MVDALLVEQGAEALTGLGSGAVQCGRLAAERGDRSRSVDAAAPGFDPLRFAPELDLGDEFGDGRADVERRIEGQGDDRDPAKLSGDLTKRQPRTLKALTQMATTSPTTPFQALIEAHARSVAAFLRGMLPPEDVDDALQETMLAALRAYPGFDGRNPRAWLLTIARRKAIDEHRARSRRPETLADPDSVAAGDPEDGDRDPELWARVGALPPKQRAAVVLRFALDLRYREVGAALDCSEAAARRSVHEAVRTLRTGNPTDQEATR